MPFKSYIKIPRELFSSEEWASKRKFSRFEAQVDLLRSAAYADGFTVRDVVLKRGQLLASMRDLADRWGWSPATVCRYLQVLRNTRRNSIRIQIETTIETGKTLITICDYDEWDFEVVDDETLDETVFETPPATPNETHIELNSSIIENKDIIHTQVFTEKGGVGENIAELIAWIKQNAPTIAAMPEPINEQHAEWMLRKYDLQDIRRLIMTMHSRGVYRHHSHAYTVFTGFAGQDYIIKEKQTEAKNKGQLITYEQMANMLPTNGGRYTQSDFEMVGTKDGNRWRLKK